MTQIAIIGAGIIGAAIAYELSLINGLNITLIDQKFPASGATGAALGVLMGVISHKKKGRGWQLRQDSLQRYETLIPEIEALTGESIPVNRQGILKLCLADDALERWENLIEFRTAQGYDLEVWDKKTLFEHCPQINQDNLIGAIYSPQDRQINPTWLTRSLVKASVKNGVNCQFGSTVESIQPLSINAINQSPRYKIDTQQQSFQVDWVIVTAGLGSNNLMQQLNPTVNLQPVLGQALTIRLDQGLGNANFQPVITGNDVHIVPINYGEYWIGATVEFPDAMGEVTAEFSLLESVKQQAIAFCPELKNGIIINTWFGKRPRPNGEAAPIIKTVPSYPQILLATGHYRNGVLLAPATALMIRDKIQNS